MPEDVDAVINRFFARPPDETPRRPKQTSRLDFDALADVQPDVVALAVDYGDEHHAFLVTVERVTRRRWKPEQPVRIGHVDGVDVDLTGVTVDNFVHVYLVGAPTEERDRLTRTYNEAFERWGATTKEARPELPEDPAIRLMQISIAVSDDVGTVYSVHSGKCGGSGTEWEAIQRFRPRPPAGVHQLHLELTVPGGAAISLAVPLS